MEGEKDRERQKEEERERERWREEEGCAGTRRHRLWWREGTVPRALSSSQESPFLFRVPLFQLPSLFIPAPHQEAWLQRKAPPICFSQEQRSGSGRLCRLPQARTDWGIGTRPHGLGSGQILRRDRAHRGTRPTQHSASDHTLAPLAPPAALPPSPVLSSSGSISLAALFPTHVLLSCCFCGAHAKTDVS